MEREAFANVSRLFCERGSDGKQKFCFRYVDSSPLGLMKANNEDPAGPQQ